MATPNVQAPAGWEKVRRAQGAIRFRPRITIRRGNTIAVNADFVSMAGIDQCDRVTFFLASDGMRLGLRFHNDATDDDSFRLSADGGAGRTKGNRNRIITAPSLFRRSPLLLALPRESATARTFEPVKDSASGLWVVNLVPCFELTLGAAAPEGTGIYRYRLGDETLYIGRGRIKDRLAAADRREWQYDRIEFSIINDEAAERRWESFWMNDYRRAHGRWPLHNRIGGVAEERAAQAG